VDDQSDEVSQREEHLLSSIEREDAELLPVKEEKRSAGSFEEEFT